MEDQFEELVLGDEVPDDEGSEEGTFLTGGNLRAFVELEPEQELDEDLILNPLPVKDGKKLMDYLRENLHEFESPHSYIGGEANSPSKDRFKTASVRCLVARLSSYEATSLSMSHSLVIQVIEELPYTFCDITFMPLKSDYKLLKENHFPVWFGTNTKLGPDKFHVLAISHPVGMEQLNVAALLHDSGIPIFKQQRLDREDIPIVILGGANSGTTAPLSGDFTTKDGTVYSCLVDCVIYGDGEEAIKEFIEVVREGKEKGWNKRQILRACHGRVRGFYEPDKYKHTYDGKGRIVSIVPTEDYVEFPVKRATVKSLDTVRPLETKILPYTGDGCCLAKGTFISTSRGLVPIEEVNSGDTVQTDQGSGLVLKRFSNGVKPVLKITTQWGETLRITENHHVRKVEDKGRSVPGRYSLGGYEPIGLLEEGDKLAVTHGLGLGIESAISYQVYEDLLRYASEQANYRSAPRMKRPAKPQLSEELAELLGYIEGDGSLSYCAVKLFFCEGEEDVEERYIALMGKLFELEPGKEQFKNGSGTSKEVPFQSTLLSAQMRAWGLKERVPSFILEAPAKVKAAYLRGLFTADGSIVAGDRNDIELTSINRTLVQQVQLLLLELGIFSGVTIRPSSLMSGTLYLQKEAYRLYIRGTDSWEKYVEKVGFSTSHKTERTKNREKRNQGTNGPFQEFWAANSILSKEWDGEAEVFDLEIEGQHCYVANGILVHNSVDIAIAGSTGCVGSAGWGACSFCREGSESPYRERSLPKVMESLKAATTNQGNKEVSFFALNYNDYSQFFPLVAESVQQGYKVGLISQRIDMLAETPEQIGVQKWLKKHNFTLGIEGISGRMRAYLNKNLSEWEILKAITHFMMEGACELKLFFIATGMETDVDVKECSIMMEKVNALRAKLRSHTTFRLSFTPLFPSAFTALQFAPAIAAIKHGQRNLDPIFNKAKKLGWGRRLSVSGEEPLISNTVNHGGRNITSLLLKSHFQDGFRAYGNVPKGTWARWKRRIDADPNIDESVLWGEKSLDYVFPWEDIAYSTSKEVLWRGYVKAVAYQGQPYCITTPTVKGVCHWQECGACDVDKVGKPDPAIMKGIVGRKCASIIPIEKIIEWARSRDKAYSLRVDFEVKDPVFRFVNKNYFMYSIPRALMRISSEFHHAFVQAKGHVRIAPGANMMKDWAYGRNIYDFALCETLTESYLKGLIEPANALMHEGSILDLKMQPHFVNLRDDVQFALYSMFVPGNHHTIHFDRLRKDFARYFERLEMKRPNSIKVKVASGKGVFKMKDVLLTDSDIRQLQYSWEPDYRGTLVRFVCSAIFNPYQMMETITERRMQHFKSFPIRCDAYMQLPPDRGEIDVFAALEGKVSSCAECGGPLEVDPFTGEKHSSGVCMSCDLDQYPVDINGFFTKELQAVEWVPQCGSSPS